MEINLNSRFDEVAVIGYSYRLVSHQKIQLPDKKTGLPYDAVVAVTEDKKKILFSGAAIVNSFDLLVSEYLSGKNPYPYPVELSLSEVSSKDGSKKYRIVDHCELIN